MPPREPAVTSAPEIPMNATRKILLVDDDEALRASLAEQLDLHEEFSTVHAGTGAEALSAVKTDRFDAILLDVGLPDMAGREVSRARRRSGVTPPALMLTGAAGEADKLLGLAAGASDYLVKHFRLNGMLAPLRPP